MLRNARACASTNIEQGRNEEQLITNRVQMCHCCCTGEPTCVHMRLCAQMQRCLFT